MAYPELFNFEEAFMDWKLFGLFGAPFRLFESLESTNLWLKERAQELPNGFLVLADTQTGGRGRFQRTWISPQGQGLYFSLLLKPNHLPIWQWPHLTQLAAITLAEVLQRIGLVVQVKWPNDLLIDGHKFCGILSEKVGSGANQALIVGIGLNINTPQSAFASLDRKATSLSVALGCKIHRAELLKIFLNAFEETLQRFSTEGIAPWLEIWRNMPNFVGSKAQLVLNEQTLQGTVMGIANDGGLLFLEEGKSANSIQVVYAGDLLV